MTQRLRIALALAVTLTLAVGAVADEPPYKQSMNVVYSEDHGVGLVLDVFAPSGDANGLGLVDVASGSFHSDRGKIEDHRRARVYDIFCGKGYCVFAVRPGSLTKFGVGEMAGNLRKGVAWVKDHAAEYHVDPDRLGIMGASAGGNLAALHAVTADAKTQVKAAGVFFPPTDFLDFRDAISAETDLADVDVRIKQFAFGPNGSPASASELVKKLTAISPALLVTDEAPPFLIIHGDADPVVPLAQSEKLLAALQGANVPAELIIKKGGGHPWLSIPEEVQVMADWFDKQLSEK